MERLASPRLSITSMSAGNTLAEGDHSEAFAGVGSDSINPVPDRTDNRIDTAGGPTADYACLITSGGGTGTRPGNDGGGWVDVNQGKSGGGWREL